MRPWAACSTPLASEALPQTRQGMLTGYDFNRIELSLPDASLIFRSAEEKTRHFLNASPQIR